MNATRAEKDLRLASSISNEHLVSLSANPFEPDSAQIAHLHPLARAGEHPALICQLCGDPTEPDSVQITQQLPAAAQGFSPQGSGTCSFSLAILMSLSGLR